MENALPCRVHQYQLGPMDNFVYLIEDPVTHQVAVVDPAWDVSFLTQQIHALKGTLSMILLTHCHFDHVNGLEEMLETNDVPIYVSLQAPDAILGLSSNVMPLKGGETVSLGSNDIAVLATPGHSPCGLCFVTDQFIITGDTVFINGCGRADFEGSNPNQLYDSLQTIKQLPLHLNVYSGHDYGDKKVDTIHNQINQNPYLRCSDLDLFIRLRMGRS